MCSFAQYPQKIIQCKKFTISVITWHAFKKASINFAYSFASNPIMIWFYKNSNNWFCRLKLLVKTQWKFPTHFFLVLLHHLLSIVITLIIVQFVSIGYLATTFIFVFLFEFGRNFIILSKPLVPLVNNGDYVLQPRLQYLWFF